jgi:hypothetical protein
VRRSFLVGRPFPSYLGDGGTNSFGAGGGVKSSYSVCASGAGPRRTPQAITRTVLTSLAWVKIKTSPAPTATDGLATLLEFSRTFPPPTTLVASERVLKKRAYHSHLSRRIVSRFSNLFRVFQSHQRSCEGVIRINGFFLAGWARRERLR